MATSLGVVTHARYCWLMDVRFSLRPAVPSDAQGCARVHHAGWVETYSDLIPASHWATDTVESRVKTWETWLEAGIPAVVAEADGEVAGIAVAGEARPHEGIEPVRERQLFLLYVVDRFHGSGMGQALLDAVLPDGAEAQLWVADPNPRARRFYERNGFSPDGVTSVDDELRLTEVRLVR